MSRALLKRCLDNAVQRASDAASATLLAALAGLAIRRLGIGLHALTVGVSEFDAVDLFLRHRETQLWFDETNVYQSIEPGVLPSGNYPPATYALLGLFFLGLPFDLLRWLWAASTLAALLWLIRWGLRVAGLREWRHQMFFALVPPASNCVATTIAFGQLSLHSISLGIGALQLLISKPRSLSVDLCAGLLFCLSLVKPTMTAPLAWLLLLAPPRWRALAVGLVAYAVATGVAAIENGRSLAALFSDWLAVSSQWASTSAAAGHNNLATYLTALGMSEWLPIFSAMSMLVFGFWVFLHRDADPWLLAGVACLFARLWTYHRGYDDVLIMVALVAVARCSNCLSEPRLRHLAHVLFLVTAGWLVLPARLRTFGEAAAPFVWIADGVFLAVLSRRVRGAQPQRA